ncbi:MAG: DUF4258 domain-containing protein [Anaerolineae bacterium]
MTAILDREYMIELQAIQYIARRQQLFFTDHAVRQMARRAITDQEVTDAILNGEILEDYPDDKYSPSCLILGLTKQGRPLHVQCSAPPRVRVVTVYQPDPKEWENNRIRLRP